MSGSSFLGKISGFLACLPKKISRKSFFEIGHKQDQDFVFGIIGTKSLPSFSQLKYIGKFYSEKEMFITKAAIFLALISSVALSIMLYKNYVIIQPSTGGEYAEAVIGAPTYINPLFAQTNDIDQDISRLIFSSLMKINEQGHVVGDLAETWKIDEAQTTYTFTLKTNTKWHDKENLTADDVIFTVQSIQDQNFKSPLYITFRNVQVRKIDERTVSFTLPEPFAPFLSVLTFGILPEHLWQEINPSHAILAELNLKPIGSGPYKFASFTKDKKGNIKQYELKRFDDYYGQGPYIKTILIKFFASFSEAQNALAEGNVDGLGFLPQNASEQSASLSGQKSLTEHKLSLPQYTALFFNQASNASLKEIQVRQALALATSRQKIIDTAFEGVAEPVETPILPGMIGYSDELQTVLYDPAKAEEILDKAGWERVYESSIVDDAPEESQVQAEQKQETTKGSVNLGLEKESKDLYKRVKKDIPLELTLTTIQKDDMIQAAETIRDLWQEIGVTVNLKIVEIGKVQKDVIKPRAYEVLLFGQILGRDPDPYPFWHSSQANDPGLNLSLYANKQVDRLLEDARKTSDLTERQKKYIEFQQQIIQDIPALFLYSLQYTYLVPNDIKGIETIRINHTSDRFSNIENWYIKTKKRIRF
ncbi:MAG: hypothetical protein AUJ34_00965 [Parcubacteria group bacterium CG1_02_41_12]|nr:MAG: hypothetical protein AUJ34_00965 [Parcubacteria group bacterium CG1_02_41_12]